ncbi:MAG: type IV pilus secretin PilQ [Gallionella sp.]|nr:type IV pilus secretin PilQ [Gallionella sp.]
MNQLNLFVRALLLLLVSGVFSSQVFAEAQIVALNIVNTGNGTSVVKVELNQPLTGVPAGFVVSKPPRITFDFLNVTNGLGKSTQRIDEGELRSADIIQAGNRTRLVLNLNQALLYDTKVEGNTLLINLRGKVSSQLVSNQSSRFAEVSNINQKHALNKVEFHRGTNGEGRVEIDLSDTTTGIDIRREDKRLVVDFLKTNLPTDLRRKLDVVDFGTAVETVDTAVRGDNVQMIIRPKGDWEYAAYQANKKFIIEVKTISATATNSSGTTGRQASFSGDKLTLDFQNITVREALNVIADFTGKNIVMSDTVTGNLTLRLKDVPWDQAMSIILQARGLDSRENGNVIQVAPRDEIAAKEKAELTARSQIVALEEVQTESIEIKYAKAQEVATMLMGAGAGKGLISARGSVTADIRTNVLFVQESPSRLEKVRELVNKIDVPLRQVMIESRVVIASNKFGRNLGSRLSYNSVDTFNVGGGLRGNIGANQVVNGPLAGTTATINTPNVNLPVAAAGTFSMLLFNSSLTKLLGLELTALETDNQGKVISSPRVLTMDKKMANIAQGVKIPYNTAGTATTPAGISFIDATLSLTVTPQITPDDHVIMDVVVTKDSPQVVVTGTPSIDTNKVTTQALVENGGTVVIGGVYQQDASTAITKVPLLGDIPLLGYLFRSKVAADTKSELLIFITPKIIKDAMDLQ